MRRMNYLRDKLKDNKDPHVFATFKFVRKHYRKLRNNEQKNFLGKCGKGGFVTSDEFYKIHDKINKNTTNLAGCSIPIDEIAAGFARLQWGDETPKKSSFKWTNKNKIKKKYPTQKLFAFLLTFKNGKRLY